jgi:hypothetical protein
VSMPDVRSKVRRHLDQPALGIAATVVVVLLSIGFISLFDWPTFGGWVAYALMCAIPATVVAGVLRVEEHASLRRLRQPLRGGVLLIGTAVVAAVVAVGHVLTVGGGVSPPLPMVNQCIILSVTVTFWMAIVWGGWPFILIRSRMVAAVALLTACYAVNYLLFATFFNYEALRTSPLYRRDLDPHGPVDGWSGVAFAVTCVSVMFLMVHFDLWPLTRAQGTGGLRDQSRLMKQPVLGLVWTVTIGVVGAGLFRLGTGPLGMAAPDFLVKVPIPFIFGSVIVLNMMRGALFDDYGQPAKGILSAIVAAVAGFLLAAGYTAMAPILTTTLRTGPPAYDAEVWLASALLAVTFPFLAFYEQFFHLWPLAAGENLDRRQTVDP